MMPKLGAASMVVQGSLAWASDGTENRGLLMVCVGEGLPVWTVSASVVVHGATATKIRLSMHGGACGLQTCLLSGGAATCCM